MEKYWVYMLQGASGRHYLGMTSDLDARIKQHRNGHTHTTKRLGGDLQLVASREFTSREDAAFIERQLKRWKNPTKAREYLS